jgi:transposase-like protein
MNSHKNARTTPRSRLLRVRRVLDQKQPVTKVAADFGLSERTVRKWPARWRAGGEPALNDRSSAPLRQRRLPAEQVTAIAALRRQRLTSPVIARRLGLLLSTVGSVLRRLVSAVSSGSTRSVEGGGCERIGGPPIRPLGARHAMTAIAECSELTKKAHPLSRSIP